VVGTASHSVINGMHRLAAGRVVALLVTCGIVLTLCVEAERARYRDKWFAVLGISESDSDIEAAMKIVDWVHQRSKRVKASEPRFISLGSPESWNPQRSIDGSCGTFASAALQILEVCGLIGRAAGCSASLNWSPCKINVAHGSQRKSIHRSPGERSRSTTYPSRVCSGSPMPPPSLVLANPAQMIQVASTARAQRPWRKSFARSTRIPPQSEGAALPGRPHFIQFGFHDTRSNPVSQPVRSALNADELVHVRREQLAVLRMTLESERRLMQRATPDG